MIARAQITSAFWYTGKSRPRTVRSQCAKADQDSRLWGNPSHLNNVVKILREKHDESTLRILVAKRNSGSFTYDGIELGGERVCQEIEDEIDTLEKEGTPIRKLSIVGYSLGGLIARYAVGLLHSRGVLDKVEPVVGNLLRQRNSVSDSMLEPDHIRNASSWCTNAASRLAQSHMERLRCAHTINVWPSALHNRQVPRHRSTPPRSSRRPRLNLYKRPRTLQASHIILEHRQRSKCRLLYHGNITNRSVCRS